MEKRWLLSGNGVNTKEDEEETLSLVDLPRVQHSKTEQKQSSNEEFNFCRSFSTKSEMCTADEVFFQGQIMPLHNSVNSEKGSMMITRNISRNESMDRYYSSGLFSSRSSSLSSSSGSSAMTLRRRQLKPPQNQFYSYPSPSPRIYKQETVNSSNLKCNKKSSMWSVLRLGLVTPPPEISFQDFKTRFHSHRSNSNKSTNSNTGGNVKNSEKKRALFGAGCKCSVDAVDTVSSNVMLVKKERDPPTVQPDEENVTRTTKLTKKQISHHRTFEWLRQLSLEGERDES